jgi:branched-subunit amino acid transport protein
MRARFHIKRSAEKRVTKVAAYILIPIQTGAIFGSAAVVFLYQVLDFASNSKYYQNSENFLSTGGIAFTVALISSIILVALPRDLDVE